MTPEVKADIAHRQKFVNRTDTLQVGDNLHLVMTELLESNPENTVASTICCARCCCSKT